MVGNATIASGTLDAALKTVARFAGLRIRMVHFELGQDADIATLTIRPAFELGAAGTIIVDAVLVVVERMLQALSGGRLSDACYRLPQAPPSWAARYAEYLNARIEFGSDRPATLSFAQSVLARPCLTADAQSYAQARLSCERDLELALSGATWATRVRALLAADAGEYPSAERIAGQLHVSPRTLFRRLAAEQHSYRELIDEQRCQLACRLLSESPLSIERVAERVGYLDTSNFSRSFRRWTGRTPRQFRATARAPTDG